MRKTLLPFLTLLGMGLAAWAQSPWTTLSPINGADVQALSFSDETHGYAYVRLSFSGNAALLSTGDGALSWQLKTLPCTPDNEIFEMDFVSPDTGFMAYRDLTGQMLGSRVARTYDGALTWQDISPDTANLGTGLGALYFSNGQLGHVGIGNRYYRTTDGGQTWTTRELGMYHAVADMDFADAQNGMFIADDGTFNYQGLAYSTQDGGVTVDSLLFSSNYSAMSRLCNPGPDSAYALRYLWSGDPVMVRTYDRWATYDSITLGLIDVQSFEMTHDLVFKGRHGYIASDQGKIIGTADYGNNWVVERQTDFIPLNDLELVGSKVYAGGSAGLLLVRDVVTSTSGSSPTAGPRLWPSVVRSGQMVHVEGIVEPTVITIHDLQGRQVAALPCEAGRQDLQLPLLASGLHLVRMDGSCVRVMVQD